MTLTIELEHDLEVQMQQEATQEGIEPEEFAIQVLRERLKTKPGTKDHPWFHRTPEERARKLEELIERDRAWPLLPDEALTRESFYKRLV